MPRPGPRPYECVRRAWHSDRHQPMRGSLISEIFRIANEIHSSATRKNKVWQDKLPTVVIRAEEIMYSKANSEAEYMDLETLWDRANDAINTIIKWDESTQTGVFLPPCIEAALELGCKPITTSRSQRNKTPTYYLNIKNPDHNFCPANNLHKTTHETPNIITPFVAHHSHIMKPPSINLSPFNPKPQIPILPNDKSLRNKFPIPSPPIGQTTKPPSVYPLYYGNGIQLKDPKIGHGAPSEPYCENSEVGFVQKPSFRHPVDINDCEEHECDLSLRLGPSLMKTSGQTQPNVGDLNNSLSRKWGYESENLDVEARMRKRKAAVSNVYENLQFCWRPKVSSANSNGGSLTNAGL
ncbi:hypothetical protein OSB04_019343 [Centaurea solstitialis]|uniref:Histone acetyltransferase n=1 Tax=Centaurea solstitialis TaxID=347529 RepID=A0AA38WCA7_9ASTR|nr:hypothetical protein OSB04_019343 [Centaurea solstitialis]